MLLISFFSALELVIFLCTRVCGGCMVTMAFVCGDVPNTVCSYLFTDIFAWLIFSHAFSHDVIHTHLYDGTTEFEFSEWQVLWDSNSYIRSVLPG